jgi:hypothetical protein
MTPTTPEAIRQAARTHAMHLAAYAAAKRWVAQHPPKDRPDPAIAIERWGSLIAIDGGIEQRTEGGDNAT